VSRTFFRQWNMPCRIAYPTGHFSLLIALFLVNL
jgi:hypothetical protein